MNVNFKKFEFRKIVSGFILLTFLTGQVLTPSIVQAQVLPVVELGIGLTSSFQPPVLRGMTVHPENPLLFDFIVDRGQDKIGNDLLKDESTKLIKYFLTSMTIPDKDAWVNLSPTEKDRIIPDALGQTEMGRAMLEQDYVLKQLAASLTNPDTELGKKYWDEVNKRGIAVGNRHACSLQNKVWIVPDGATVVEKHGFAYITESKLTVMLDEDYGAMQQNISPPHGGGGNKEVQVISTAVFRQLILPKLIEEVNTGKNFAPTRQVYQSVILAAWYKRALKDSLLGKIYADKSKIAGVETDVKDIKQKVYEQYLEAFKKGAYKVIKEEDGPDGEIIPRKYFSGGEKWTNIREKINFDDRDSSVNATLTKVGSSSVNNVIVQVRAGEINEVTAIKDSIANTTQVTSSPVNNNVSPEDRPLLFSVINYLGQLVQIVYPEAYGQGERNLNGGVLLNSTSQRLINSPEIKTGALFRKYLELIHTDQMGRKTYRLGLSDKQYENVEVAIRLRDPAVGEILILTAQINGQYYAVVYKKQTRESFYPVVESVFQAIKAIEQNPDLDDSQGHPKKISFRAVNQSESQIPTRQDGSIDFKQFYAGAQYDRLAFALLDEWQGFSLNYLAKFIETHGIAGINSFPDVDVASLPQRKKLLRIYPKNYTDNPEPNEKTSPYGFRIRKRQTQIASNIPSLAVLWNVETSQVERIAIHLFQPKYDGSFIEITPTMQGFSELSRILNRLIPTVEQYVPRRNMNFTWPYIEGQKSDFEQTVNANPFLRFAFLQSQRFGFTDDALILDRGTWTINDLIRSEGDITGAQVEHRFIQGIPVKFLGKRAFGGNDADVLFHEQLHVLFHQMLRLKKLTMPTINRLLSNIRQTHQNFIPWFMQSPIYQGLVEDKTSAEAVVMVIAEWISYTSQQIFNANQQTSVLGNRNVLIGSPWGNNISNGDIELLQELGFLPAAASAPIAPGGIDFDPSKLNLQIKRDGHGVPLPLPQQNLENININGLYPVIINIMPINAQTLPILGQLDAQSEVAVSKS